MHFRGSKTCAALAALLLAGSSGCARELIKTGACVAGESTGSATSSAARGSSVSAGDMTGMVVGGALMAAGAALEGRGQAPSTAQPVGGRPRQVQQRESGCSAVMSTP